jgi:hypothetical protein
VPDQPEDLLRSVVITLLMPLFLPLLNDVSLARQAAAQALRGLQETIDADLITLAQTVAFGIAVTNTLCLSMAEGLDTKTVLKINTSAASLSRCESRNRGALSGRTARKAPPAAPAKPAPPPETPEEQAANQAESDKVQKVARTLMATALDAAERAKQKPGPVTVKDPWDPAKTIKIDPEKLTWVFSYAQVAEDCIMDPDSFAGGSRKEANARAKMLCEAAYEALRGIPPTINPLIDFKTRAPRQASARHA